MPDSGCPGGAPVVMPSSLSLLVTVAEESVAVMLANVVPPGGSPIAQAHSTARGARRQGRGMIATKSSSLRKLRGSKRSWGTGHGAHQVAPISEPRATQGGTAVACLRILRTDQQLNQCLDVRDVAGHGWRRRG